MYNIGDTVMYPGAGVCRIAEIETKRFAKTAPKTYYILKPVYDNVQTTIYCPVDNEKINLQRLLTAEDIRVLLKNLPKDRTLWIDNDTERKREFTAILRSGDRADILQLICEIHENRVKREAAGKKLHLADEKILREAEKIIHQELAYSMQIDVSEVSAFIMKELEIEEK